MNTPVSIHGALRVSDGRIVDSLGRPFRLYGMSSHGIGHFPQFIGYEGIKTLRDEWHTNCVRIAAYTDGNGGYCRDDNKQKHMAIIKQAIEDAVSLGMYIIVDWHVLVEGSPLVHKDEAAEFFREITSAYGKLPNIIYEICNEPNRCEWDEVRAYGDEIIPVIREKAPDSIILCGSPVWSQRIDEALNDRFDDENVMYTLHFYAATHGEGLRNLTADCSDKGLPVFISEFGICSCTGNGELDYAEGDAWKQMLDERGISFICWNLSNCDESSSVLKADCEKTHSWEEDDLNPQGVWIRKWFDEEYRRSAE